ncbi:MAG: hypothetical protein MHM6MM_004575 [Cercozoa sp. M6MM]
MPKQQPPHEADACVDSDEDDTTAEDPKLHQAITQLMQLQVQTAKSTKTLGESHAETQKSIRDSVARISALETEMQRLNACAQALDKTLHELQNSLNAFKTRRRKKQKQRKKRYTKASRAPLSKQDDTTKEAAKILSDYLSKKNRVRGREVLHTLMQVDAKELREVVCEATETALQRLISLCIHTFKCSTNDDDFSCYWPVAMRVLALCLEFKAATLPIRHNTKLLNFVEFAKKEFTNKESLLRQRLSKKTAEETKQCAEAFNSLAEAQRRFCVGLSKASHDEHSTTTLSVASAPNAKTVSETSVPVTESYFLPGPLDESSAGSETSFVSERPAKRQKRGSSKFSTAAESTTSTLTSKGVSPASSSEFTLSSNMVAGGSAATDSFDAFTFLDGKNETAVSVSETRMKDDDDLPSELLDDDSSAATAPLKRKPPPSRQLQRFTEPSALISQLAGRGNPREPKLHSQRKQVDPGRPVRVGYQFSAKQRSRPSNEGGQRLGENCTAKVNN